MGTFPSLGSSYRTHVLVGESHTFLAFQPLQNRLVNRRWFIDGHEPDFPRLELPWDVIIPQARETGTNSHTYELEGAQESEAARMRKSEEHHTTDTENDRYQRMSHLGKEIARLSSADRLLFDLTEANQQQTVRSLISMGSRESNDETDCMKSHKRGKPRQRGPSKPEHPVKRS
jgi:hypothetical protein